MRSAAGRVLAGVASVLLVAAGLWVAYLLGRRTGAASRTSSAPIVAAIRKIAQLATVEIQVADVVRYEEVKSFFVFDFPKSATLRLRGRVLGGFDLSSPGFTVWTDPARRIVRVRMPRPRLLAVDPRFEWFDERSGWINPITPADRNRWMLWARGQLGRAAKDAGLEAKADEHARELLVAAAQAMGWKAEVTFAGGPPPAMPILVTTPAVPG
jgi:Protein of unknown function (DUF4230)